MDAGPRRAAPLQPRASQISNVVPSMRPMAATTLFSSGPSRHIPNEPLFFARRRIREVCSREEIMKKKSHPNTRHPSRSGFPQTNARKESRRQGNRVSRKKAFAAGRAIWRAGSA